MKKLVYSALSLFFVLDMASSNLLADYAVYPVGAVTGSGTVLSVWESDASSVRAIESSTLSFGGSPTTPVAISASGIDSYLPQLAMNESGNAVAVWYAVDPTLQIQCVYAAMLSVGGSWSSPQVISDVSNSVNNGLQVAITSTNEIMALWNSIDSTTSNPVVVVATASFGGSWNSPEILSTP